MHTESTLWEVDNLVGIDLVGVDVVGGHPLLHHTDATERKCFTVYVLTPP